MELERKAALVQQVEGIDREVLELEKQEQKLIASENSLSTQVEIFRTKKESIKAEYSAAEAQVKSGEESKSVEKGRITDFRLFNGFLIDCSHFLFQIDPEASL